MTPPAAPAIPTLLDERALADLHEDFASTGDLEELAKLITGFLDRGQRDVVAVAAAVAAGDLAGAQDAAHKLKGASRTLGASLAGTVADRVEAAARAGDAEALRRSVSELEVVFSLSRAALSDAVEAIGGGDPLAASGSGPAGSDGALRALLVDDEPIALAVLRATVERLGHEAIVATDAEQALEAVDRVRPDIVVTDVHMPGRNGIELAREIRARVDPAPYVAVLSATGGQGEKWVGSIVDAALSKPVREDELGAVLALAASRDRRS